MNNLNEERKPEKGNLRSSEEALNIADDVAGENNRPTREMATVRKLSGLVLEDESVKWDTIREVADSFGKLGDDLEQFSQNFLFQKDMGDLERKDASLNIMKYMNLVSERIEDVHVFLDGKSVVLGDLITSLLRHPLSMLQERVENVSFAALSKNPDKLKNSYNLFESYRVKFFSEFSQVLGFSNDPFARADADPFEKEITENILNALKVPALPEGMMRRFSEKKKSENFEKDYNLFMKIELSVHKEELEEEIKMKRAELKEKSPLKKEYEYWKQMTPEKRYKQLLRIRAFELLKSSAGKKRLTPDDMWELYQKAKRLN